MKNQSFVALPASRVWVIALLVLSTLGAGVKTLYAQSSASQYRVLMDVAHGQKFYNNPGSMHPSAGQDLERVKYMTGELAKNARALNASLDYLNGEIKPEALAKTDLLFIHIPSAKYSPAEVKAVTDFVNKGGSLLLVMDVDYWSTLAQTNVNDLIKPYGIQFGSDSPDSLSGGYTKANAVTPKPLKITYHGGRHVNGGTPFCYNSQTDAYPFGVYQAVNGGGKLIVMGDGMTSLYMTEWNGVADYQCSEFMNDALGWLLK